MVVAVRVNSLKPLTWTPFLSSLNSFNWPCSFISIPRKHSKSTPLFSQMATSEAEPQIMTKVIDSHLHVWASPQEAAEKYPYFPGQEPSLPGHVDYLLEVHAKGCWLTPLGCMWLRQ
ncbi:uncharacterized protein LOC132626205 isoform X2 [Lycium barbarum]|uniref:uncharacterized protein LOC132626205 isoform X2 n=1 Tax=Lycium barbarum TaxID=112863 RepID=UPI00293EB725|nr:uncharacterized protein LOC132626205 isoform X2 [Lycium barbarum]